jgi:hypothetical protein
MALFAAARIAKVTVEERAEAAATSALVGDLYSDAELPFRTGFRLPPMEAFNRWDAGIEDLARMSIVVGVATVDELLGAAIHLLRATHHDPTEAGTVDTGVSAKLSHLSGQCCLVIDSDARGLYALLIEIRHAVTHYGGQQLPVRQAWERLSGDAQEWWTAAASRGLPLTQDEAELRVDDRELLAALKTLDRVALVVSDGLRMILDDDQWADLIVGEYRQLNLSKANDPGSNLRRIVTFGRSIWRLTLAEEQAAAALSRSTPPEYVPLVARQ